MITFSKILYSRTQNRDYRWIYTNKDISYKLLNIMKSDYYDFERQKSKFIEQKNQLIYHFEKNSGAVFYKFCKMDITDLMGREIYGLNGIFVDLDLIQLIYGLFAAFALTFDSFLADTSDIKYISDESENLNEMVQFNLDNIWQNYYNNKSNVIYENFFKAIEKEYKNNNLVILENFYYPINNQLLYNQQNKSNVNERCNDSNFLIYSNRVDEFEIQRNPIFNTEIVPAKIKKESQYNHQIIEHAFTQQKISTRRFCKKCDSIRKVKVIVLDVIDGRPIKYLNTFFGRIRKMTGEITLYAYQCQFCNTKFIVKCDEKVVDEWI